VCLALQGIAVLLGLTAVVIGLFPATARHGKAVFVDTAIVAKTLAHEDGEGGIRGIDRWEEIAYHVAIVDRSGARLAVVTSHRIPRVSAGEEVLYPPIAPRWFVFAEEFDRSIYYFGAGLLLLASGLLLLAAKYLVRSRIRKSEANQALQHNDPTSHEPCLRTPRSSRGRG